MSDDTRNARQGGDPWVGKKLDWHPGRIVARYPSVDEKGEVQAYHVRFEPGEDGATKGYRWQLPDGTWSLKRKDPKTFPLYGLPDLLAAPKDCEVIVCEGEKACDALRGRGFCAVGTYGSSTVPSVDALRSLVGHEVVLWADADDVGLRHMQQVGSHLRELDVPAWIVQMEDAPEGADAGDWTGTDEELKTWISDSRWLYEEAPERSEEAREHDPKTKPLPKNPEAEKAVLGAILTYSTAMDIMSTVGGQLTPKHFYCAPSHNKIFEVMLSLHEKGAPIDVSSVASRLNADVSHDIGGAAYLRTLCDESPTVASVEHDAKILVDCKIRRDLIGNLSALNQQAYADDCDLPAVLADMTRGSEALGSAWIAGVGETAQSDTERLDELIIELESRDKIDGVLGLKTRTFAKVDRILNGFNQGLYILGGAPTCGKTSLVKQIADEVADVNRVPVVFFSFEQSARELVSKTLARLSTTPTEQIEQGPHGDRWEQVQKAANEYRAFSDLLTIFEGGRETTPSMMRLEAERIRQKAKTEKVMVIVDYIQIAAVDNPKDFASHKDRVDWLCTEYRRLARRLDCPVLAVSSLNRQAYGEGKERKFRWAFKESGGLDYSADVAITIQEDRERTEELTRMSTAPEKARDHRRILDLDVIKNRNGARRSVTLCFRADTLAFTETMDEPEELTPDGICPF